MPTDTVSLDVLAGQAKVQMEEQRLLRKDVADMMQLLDATCEPVLRVERHGKSSVATTLN